jgi:hypothetical protein
MRDNSTEDFDVLFVKKRSGIKLFIIVFSLVILVIASIYAYLSIAVVRDRMALAQSQAQGSPEINSSLLPQLKEKAWIESRIEMASSDSIGLAIDLESHVIQLELKGVVIMSSKIRDYSISGLIRKMDGNVYFSMFGSPLTIKQFKSSIAKNPLRVVQAPKDTIAAMAAADAAIKKDSLLDENVFWTVKLNRDFELNIQGIDSISDAKSKYKLGKGFEFKRDLKNISTSLEHIIQFKKPTYTPEILISIPENEAKAILRALPSHAFVTIKI